MAEKEGLFGLRPHPFGAAALCLAFHKLLVCGRPSYLDRGFKSYYLNGGEGGIRTLDGATNPILP